MGKHTVAIAGEYLAVRPFSQSPDPDFIAVREFLQNADVAYAHLEMNFGRFDSLYAGRGDTFGSYMLTNSEVADDLRWLGIDVLSMANNHSLDFGPAGLLSTLEACRSADLACAGTGQDLDEARKPVYRETSLGRVALVSVASGNKPQEWAGTPKDTMIGRPGVNPLRVNMCHEVTAEAASTLREAAHALGILRTPEQTSSGSTGHRLAEDQFQLKLPSGQSATGDFIFRETTHNAIDTTCHSSDLDANLRSIRSAANMANLVMVAHHFNLSEGPRGDYPPAFVKEFAHKAIDEGADIFVGHGWHKTLGIEIYKGKPIFYGLGNFFAQSAFLEHVPADGYETWGHDEDAIPSLTPDMWPLHPGLGPHRQTWWSSALIAVEFSDGEMSRILLRPVELGQEVSPDAPITRSTGKSSEHGLTEGRPTIASGKDAAGVLSRLRRLSEEFGTYIAIEGEEGSIRLDTHAAVVLKG